MVAHQDSVEVSIGLDGKMQPFSQMQALGAPLDGIISGRGVCEGRNACLPVEYLSAVF